MFETFLRLFLLETRAAWMLLVVMLVEYLAAVRSDRLVRLGRGAKPPFWRDATFLRECRAQLVSRLWVVLVLLSTLAWANASDFDGVSRMISLGVGSVVVARAWIHLRSDALARSIYRLVISAAVKRDLEAAAPVPVPQAAAVPTPSPPTTDDADPPPSL